MRKIATVIFFFIAIFPRLHAQYKMYKKGYIINSNNDTVRGYIQEKPDYELLEALDFSIDATASNNKTYSKKDLNGFGFDNGRIFEKVYLKRAVNSDTIRKEYMQKKVLSGKIDMYMLYRNANDKEYSGMEVTLRNNHTKNAVNLREPVEKQIKKADGTTYNRSDNRYIMELTRIKTDDPAQPYKNQPLIPYSKKAIIKDLQAYNEQFTNQYPSKKYNEQREISYTLVVSPPVFNTALKFSLFRDRTLIERTNGITWSQEISYATYKTTLRYMYYEWKEYISNTVIMSYLPFMVKYQMSPSMKIIPYGYAGAGYALYNLPYLKRDNNGVPSITELSRLSFNYSLGAGIKVKASSHWHVHALVSYARFSATNLGVGCSYSFIKNK